MERFLYAHLSAATSLLLAGYLLHSRFVIAIGAVLWAMGMLCGAIALLFAVPLWIKNARRR